MSMTRQNAPRGETLRMGSDHAERRWRAIQKVINHDLPNQLIAIQGLLQLLAVDEADRLSPDGREILTRVQGTSSRLLEMIHQLKELAKAQDVSDRPAMVSLMDLMSEAVVEVKQNCPGLDVGLTIPDTLEKVHAAPSALRQVAVLLLKVAVQSSADDVVRLVIGGDRVGKATTIWLGFATSTAERQAGHTIWSARTFEDRLELALARELVHGWGEVEVGQDPARGRLFLLRIASP